MSLYDMLNNRNKFKRGGIYYAQNDNVVRTSSTGEEYTLTPAEQRLRRMLEQGDQGQPSAPQQAPMGQPAPQAAAEPAAPSGYAGFTPGSLYAQRPGDPIYGITGVTGAPTEFQEEFSWSSVDPRLKNPLSYFKPSEGIGSMPIVKPGDPAPQNFFTDWQGNVMTDAQGNPISHGTAMETSYSLDPAAQIEGIQRAGSQKLDAINFNAADLDDSSKREALLSSPFGQKFFVDDPSVPLSEQYQSYARGISKFIDSKPQVIDQAITDIESSDNPEHEKLANMLSKETTAEGKRNLLKKLATDGKIGYAHTILNRTEQLSPTTGKISIGGGGTGMDVAVSNPGAAQNLLVDMFFPQPEDHPRTRQEYDEAAKRLNLPADGKVVVRVGDRNIPNEYFFDYIAAGVANGVNFNDDQEATKFASEFMDNYGYVPSSMPSWVTPDSQMNIRGYGVGGDPRMDQQYYNFMSPLLAYTGSSPGNMSGGSQQNPSIWGLQNMVNQRLQQQREMVENQKARQAESQKAMEEYFSKGRYSMGGKIKVKKGY